MKDKLYLIVTILFFILGATAISINKILLAMAFLAIGAGMLYSRSTGSYNKRNIYDKIVEAPDLFIEELYEKLKNMDTFLGRCWKGHHVKHEGEVIVFGPSLFKDYIVISKDGDKFELKSGSEISNLVPDGDRNLDEEVLNVEGLEVTTKRYSAFAGMKVMTSVLLSDITDLITRIVDSGAEVPESLDKYTLYHHNSSDKILRDLDDNEYAKTNMLFNPIELFIYDMKDEEVVRLIANEKAPPGRMPRKGCDVTVSGNHYGTITRVSIENRDGYRLESPDGIYEVTAFPAIRRANVSCNYIITLDGVKKAVLAGMVGLDFEKEGFLSNDVIMSMDDDYLPVYLAIQRLIMKTNRFMR